MDEGPRLIWLLLAGVLPLLWLKDQMTRTPKGRKLFALLVVLYLLVAAGAAATLLTRRPAAPARSDAPLIDT